MGQKEKWKGFRTIKRGGTGARGWKKQSDVGSVHCHLRPWRCPACAVDKGHVWVCDPSVAGRSVSVSVAHVTTK